MHGRVMGPKRRRAAAAVFVLVSIPVVLGMAALTVDVGIMFNTRADLQNTADAAALAAIDVLAHGGDYPDPLAAATESAVAFVHSNTVMGRVVSIDPAVDIIFGRAVYDSVANAYGFTPGDLPTNAIRVIVRETADSPNGQAPLYFAGIFGMGSTDISAKAAATFSRSRYDEQPCDYVPAAGEVLLCAPVGNCGVDSDDSGAMGANDSDSDSDSGGGGGGGGGEDDSDDSSTVYTDCFSEDSESGLGGPDPRHTIVVDVNAALGFLANGATAGACACVAGTPDDPSLVEICHVSANNPNNSFVLTVNAPAVAAHLAHGDSLGDCPDQGTLRMVLIE